MTVRVAFRITDPKGWTGGVNYILNICRVLRAHAPDIEPVLFAPPDLEPDLLATVNDAAGAPPFHLRDRAQRDDLAAIFGIDEADSTAAFQKAGVDLVFESKGYHGRRPKLPMLAWLPDFQHRHLPQFFSRRQWLAREWRFRTLIANRGHILVSSQDAHNDMMRFYGGGRAKAHVAPFAISMNNPARFEDGERVRLELGLPERFIFLPNQFWIHKNHRLVVEALGALRPSERPCIVASGLPNDPRAPDVTRDLLTRLASHQAEDSFRMVGHLPYAHILALNARADALINPSLFEGWSTTVEEAKALGTPMLLSNLPVHREQVGGDTIFFDPHDPADCAAALRASMARPPRQAEEAEAVVRRNLADQRRFAGKLREAILGTLSQS